MVFFFFVLHLFIPQVHACEDLESPEAEFQVAWISPVRKTSRAKAMIEVVPFAKLRTWVHNNKVDAKQLLQYTGQLPANSKKKINPADYKITVFDIRKDSLCRPIKDKPVGEVVGGVSVCLEKHAKPINWRSRSGYTGCGYVIDTKTGLRSLDVFRISWIDASTNGFCVLPLQRFLSEA